MSRTWLAKIRSSAAEAGGTTCAREAFLTRSGWEIRIQRKGKLPREVNQQKKAAARVSWTVYNVWVVGLLNSHRPSGILSSLKSRGKERDGRRARVRARARWRPITDWLSRDLGYTDERAGGGNGGLTASWRGDKGDGGGRGGGGSSAELGTASLWARGWLFSGEGGRLPLVLRAQLRIGV